MLTLIASINWFLISSILLTITCFFLIVILARFGKESSHKIWLLFNLSVFIWGLGSTIFGTISTNSHLSYVVWVVASSGATFIPVLLLHMAKTLLASAPSALLAISYFQATVAISFFSASPGLIISPRMILYRQQFFTPTPGSLYWIWFGFWFLTVSFAHYYLFKYYSTQPKGKKQRIEFLILGVLIGFTCGTINFFHFKQISFFQFGNLGIAIYCLIVTYAIFRHRMLGIEIIFQKGLAYFFLFSVVSCIYLIVTLGTEWAFRGIVGYHSTCSNLLSAIIIALLFNPLRNRIQRITDKMIFGKTMQEIVTENMLLKNEIIRSERLKTVATLSLGLAHEIKNPITTIKTFAEFLPEKYTDKDFVEKFSKIIPQEVDRINGIVHKLLDFSKPVPPTIRTINIQDLISDVLVFLNSDFLKSKITVSEDFKDTNLLVNADSNQIKQTLFNLLSNAKDAMVNGGNICIKTTLASDHFALIEIIDSGSGITKDSLNQIFDPFFTTKDGGTGLGLSICHQIIKNNKGRIEIESEVNRGTTVRIFLPRGN